MSKTFAMQHKAKSRSADSAVRAGRPAIPAWKAHQPAVRQILNGPALQSKLTIGAPHDKYEQEADRVAEQVMDMPDYATPATQTGEATASPLHQIQRLCSDCDEELQRQTIETQPSQTDDNRNDVSHDVHDVLQSRGQPLTASARDLFEPRFGHDFRQVVLHTDQQASDSARALQAKAYTVGRHMVFAEGQYQPESTEGRALLAHELTHVVQQRHLPDRHCSPVASLELGSIDTPAEREADAVAELVTDGELTASVSRRETAPVVQRFPLCRHLLAATEGTVVPENAVQREIYDRMAVAFGIQNVQRELTIPGGTHAPHREDTPPDVIIFGRAGFGRADIALRHGSLLEIMEIKRAEWAGRENVVAAEAQARYYVEQANGNAPWLAARGVTGAQLMPISRWVPPSPMMVDGTSTSLAWCDNGIMSFKSVQDWDAETFVCANIGDQGLIDNYLERFLGRAQDIVDDFIDSRLAPAIDRVIQQMSIGEIIRRILQSPAAQEFLEELLGEGAGLAISLLPIDQLAAWIENSIDAESEAIIRSLALSFKDQLMSAVRLRVQNALRGWLQAGLTSLCVAAEAVSIERLLQWLNQQMRQLILGELAAAVAMVAAAVVADAVATAVAMVLAVIAVVAAVVLLWEVVIPALVAAFEGVTLAEVMASVIVALRGLVPQAQRLLWVLSSEFQ